MPKQAEQKTRLLALYDILKRETDEDHYITVSRLAELLLDGGIEAERKTILDDLHALRDFGADIINRRGRGGGICLASRDFELPELKLLVDAVQSSKFISEKKSRVLIDKLCTLTSRHDAGALERQVYVSGRVKSDAAALYSVDAIHKAIAAGVRVTFLYCEWTREKKLVPRHGGARYEVSPYLLAWEDGNYYLVGYDGAAGVVKHFRVDKMKDVNVTDLPCEGADAFKGFDPALYSRETFGMYGGDLELVTLVCDESLVGVVLDRFGEDVTLFSEGEGTFRISVRVRVSPVFLAWVIGYGKKMKVKAPEQVADMVRALAEETIAVYRK